MNQDDIRQTRIENLKKAQADRKENAIERVYKAIERLTKTGGKINFSTVAKEANVSVSYLYKYPDVKQQIGELRNKQSSIPRDPLSKPASSSQVKIISRLKERIKELDEQNRELRRKNEALAGQVYRVHHLQSQVERQQETIQDLQVRLKEAFTQTNVATITPITQAKSHQATVSIQEEIKSLGIKMTESLAKVIRSHDEEIVRNAIEAFKQYRQTHEIKSLAGCLRRAIEEGWVPNLASTPSTPEQDEFDQFYSDAVATGFLLDIPKKHLPVQGGEIMVKINRPSAFAPWTSVHWRDAKIEHEEQYGNK